MRNDETRAAHPGPEASITATTTRTSVSGTTDGDTSSASSAVYGARPIKRRRRTQSVLADLDAAIVAAVQAEYPVSLRGVFYRVVSMGAAEKTEAEYKRIGQRLIKLRAEGRVPYSWITDGTRLMRKPRTWRDLDEMLEDAGRTYRRTLWNNSNVEVIVLSEKDAISGAIAPVTVRWDIELGITRGYPSVTFMHDIAETVQINTLVDRTTYIYNIGDHDPSGVDAWRALQAGVRAFAPVGDVVFDRLAVTPDQIELLELPTRPTKKSDSRSKSFTGESVEVDAIPPTVLRQIVENAIVSHVDQDALRITEIAERSERDVLTAMIGGAR